MLTPKEAAAVLNITEGELRDLRYRNRVAFVKLGYGLSGKVDTGKNESAQAAALLDIQISRCVHFAGALAGYVVGPHMIGSSRVLVTSSPKVIEPVDGDWACLRQLIEGLFGADGGTQLPYFYGWVKVAYEALRAGETRPGQAMVMCGPHNCGKSLLQNLLTEILGGRAAKPYQCMSGGTAFNADLFGAEHLMVEDEQPSTDIRARRAFGAQIKNVTVNEYQRMHGKGKDALILKPFWRFTISLNDEDENIQVLPPLDDSLADKMIILKAQRAALPMPSETGEQRKAFWSRLIADLPGFLFWLVTWEIPEPLRCRRFGLVHYHHPDIVSVLDGFAPEARLLTLIDSTFFPEPNGAMVQEHSQFEGTAEEIERTLTGPGSNCALDARRLFSWSFACGTYLGRLAKKKPDRVQQLRQADSRRWRVLSPRTPADRACMTP
jgi:hypothetical protein